MSSNATLIAVAEAVHGTVPVPISTSRTFASRQHRASRPASLTQAQEDLNLDTGLRLWSSIWVFPFLWCSRLVGDVTRNYGPLTCEVWLWSAWCFSVVAMSVCTACALSRFKVAESYSVGPLMSRGIFVTVGTTLFDDLVREVDSRSFHRVARELGFQKLVIQYGNGLHIPSLGDEASSNDHDDELLPLEAYRFKPTLDEDVAQAALVISHAGAGSLLEALRAGKRLLVVVNPILMGNHQLELAEAVSEQGYCFMAPEPGRLLESLKGANAELKPMPPIDLSGFYSAVSDVVGVSPSSPKK